MRFQFAQQGERRVVATVLTGEALAATGKSGATTSHLRALPGLWLAVGAVLSGLLLLLFFAQESLFLKPFDLASCSFYTTCMLAAGLRWRLRHPHSEVQRVIRDGAEYIGLFTFVVVAGALASYPMAAASSGFADVKLEQIDRLLGFNWIAWYDVVAAHPILQWGGSLAYQSIYLSPLLLLCSFAHSGRKVEARGLIAAFWLAAAITLLVFNMMPARGPLAFLWHGPIPYMPASELYQAQLIPVLRDHYMHEIALGSLRGLVCAPSFHTTGAVLFILFARHAGALRWPLTILNLLMLLSTPVEGTHYLVDMLAGAVVALVAHLAILRLTQSPVVQRGDARMMTVPR